MQHNGAHFPADMQRVVFSLPHLSDRLMLNDMAGRNMLMLISNIVSLQVVVSKVTWGFAIPGAFSLGKESDFSFGGEFN